MSIKSASATAGTGILSALGAIVTAGYNGPRQERIDAIDRTIASLLEERTQLVSELIES